jgi:hypothetical protein
MHATSVVCGIREEAELTAPSRYHARTRRNSAEAA